MRPSTAPSQPRCQERIFDYSYNGPGVENEYENSRHRFSTKVSTFAAATRRMLKLSLPTIFASNNNSQSETISRFGFHRPQHAIF